MNDNKASKVVYQLISVLRLVANTVRIRHETKKAHYEWHYGWSEKLKTKAYIIISSSNPILRRKGFNNQIQKTSKTRPNCHGIACSLADSHTFPSNPTGTSACTTTARSHVSTNTGLSTMIALTWITAGVFLLGPVAGAAPIQCFVALSATLAQHFPCWA